MPCRPVNIMILKTKVFAYMAAVYAATDVMTDVIPLGASKELRNASRIQT